MFLFITILNLIMILTGIISLRRGGPVSLYLLLAISIIDCLNENILALYSVRWWNIPANVFYNAYSIIEIMAWTFIYRSVFKTALLKNVIVLCGGLTVLYSLAEFFIIHSPAVFHSASYSCFSITSLFFSLCYLLKVSRKEYHHLGKDPIFWLCAGAICFHSIFLINLFTTLDAGYWQRSEALEIFHLLQSAAIIIYYLLLCTAYIISFYRYRRKTTPALSSERE